jgi:esterase/lipase superfamily enzyme
MSIRSHVLKDENTVPPSGQRHVPRRLAPGHARGRDTMVFIHGFNVSFLDALTPERCSRRACPTRSS